MPGANHAIDRSDRRARALHFRRSMIPSRAPVPGIALVVALIGCENPDPRADIVVYGDHVPAFTQRGDPFPNPFTARSMTGDPETTAVLKAIPGLQHPRGAVSWSVAAWAKYVLLGNYAHIATPFGQHIEDQRIGLYDSEHKAFCQLDLDPARSTNASAEWLSVADPTARRTRIYYEGIDIGGAGFPFGFIAADLDNPDPCDATTGWIPRSKGFLPADLNAAASAAQIPDAPCPGGFCGFDGMIVLHHDRATNTDTVVLGNWGDHRIVLAQVDGAEQLHVLKVHVLPPWQPDDGNPQVPDACYSLLPVGRPAVDPTRPVSDLRFLQSYDKVCAPGDTPGCPSKSICPLTATTCTTGCADSYCTTPFFGSYLPAPAPGGTCKDAAGNVFPVSCSHFPLPAPEGTVPPCFDLGVATRSCLAVHPSTICTPQANHTSTCTCPPPPTEAPPTPSQEFRVNLAAGTLDVTSFIFQTAPAENTGPLGAGYTNEGDVYLIAWEHILDPNHYRARIVHYPRNPDGEHDYRDPGATLASRAGKIVPVQPANSRDFPLKTAGGFGFLSLPIAGLEVGGSMYIVSKDHVERDHFDSLSTKTWLHDARYKLSYGVGAPADLLPREAYTCAPRTVRSCTANADCADGLACTQGWCQPTKVVGCQIDDECPSDQRCPALRCAATKRPCTTSSDCGAMDRCVTANISIGEGSPSNVELGGAPASLWSSPHAAPLGDTDLPHVNTYLNRVPVAVDLPGVHTSTVAPALVWSVNPNCATSQCDRVWLFGAPEGSAAGTLQVRTRDQGLWAASFTPLPTNVPLAGGPAALYTASSTEFTDATVEVFARRQSDGRLVRTQLTTRVDCGTTGVAACQWAPWAAVPGSPVTDVEPTAAIAQLDNTAVVFLAVKDTAGQLWIAERRAGALSAWRAIAGLTSDASPSLVFKADDSQVWLFARDRQDGAIRYARVDGGRSGPWTTAGGAGAVLPWSTAPTAAFTGRLRLLVGSGTFPSVTYQTTFDGAWDDWKPITSGAGTTRRPAAADVNGDLNVVTTFVTSLQEQLVK